MTHDHKTWEEFNKDSYNEQYAMLDLLYQGVLDKLKPKGNNLTPAKKKRKKKEKPKRNKK